jgi:preprotein translocase subunit SecA
MSDFLGLLLKRIFGSSSQRYVKTCQDFVQKTNELEVEYQKLSDEELKAVTDTLKSRIEEAKNVVFKNKTLNDLLAELQEVPEERRKSLKLEIISGLNECALTVLPEAYSAVREACKRHLQGHRHFDVQLIGGRVLHEGRISEMATGEGKTLVATLPCYINVLLGLKVHVVSVNDYLVKRDRDWMAPIYESLGLTVGAIQSSMDSVGDERKLQYSCDITYGTNNELGFDYLRDNMKVRREDQVQGPLHFAIIDEVDSILIDEARTPLIISGPARDDINRYKLADRVSRVLISKQQSAIRETQTRIKDLKLLKKSAVDQGIPESRVESAAGKFSQDPYWLTEDEAQAIQHTIYFVVERDRKSVHMTHAGVTAAQEEAKIGSFYVGANMEWPHLIDNSLRAHVVYEKDKDYVSQNGEIIIVDEFTGRLMYGRQWSDGLHQAVEAKENVTIKEETQTLATITIQNFFKLYCKLSGMTGTAMTESEEFSKIYSLDVISIPTNRPINRIDHNDRIYRTVKEKYDAIVEEIRSVSTVGFPNDADIVYRMLKGLREVYKKDSSITDRIDAVCKEAENDGNSSQAMKDLLIELTPDLPGGRPVLVGTTSIENSEKLSTALTRKYGIEHEVLNAKQHAREAEIVAKAGHRHPPKHGGKTPEGNVTIATNMAGRGTDIKLEPGVVYPKCIGEFGKSIATKCCIRCPEYDGVCAHCFKPKLDPRFPEMGKKFCSIEPPCGLHIIGTERHESRRIDNQLRGRAGRQGDPGSSRFFLSLEDDLLRLFAGEWVLKMLNWLGMEEGMAIEDKRISKGIERAQKKVEERNFSIRKNLLEYDEIMDYQRQAFYRQRQQILDGKMLDRMIMDMIGDVVEEAVHNFLDPVYPAKGICEWAKSTLSVNINPGKIDLDFYDRVEDLLKRSAKEESQNTIQMTINEYLDPDIDRKDWDLRGLAKWAMSRFGVNLSITHLGQIEPEQIQEELIQSAETRIDALDCSALKRFFESDFSKVALAEWVKNKFGLVLRLQDIQDKDAASVKKVILETVQQAYHRREVEFPVDFALSRTIANQDAPASAYGPAALVDWVNAKYAAGWSIDTLADKDIRQIRKEIISLSESFLDKGKLEEEVEQSIQKFSGNSDELKQWVQSRYHSELAVNGEDAQTLKEKILSSARSFLRSELTGLEGFILLNTYDSSWKEHLLGMDHLKSAIGLRGYAEKDPKIEYKREGTQMFQRMLRSIRQQVTDLVLKVQLAGSQPERSVWSRQEARHAEASSSFTDADRQAAMQQQGEAQTSVKTIRRDKPKVGPNDPCPCGSGKKHKKCCGRMR